MREFLVEVADSSVASKIKDDSTIRLSGAMGIREGAVVLSVKPGGFDKPNSRFVHVKMKRRVQDYFIENVNTLVTDNGNIPILGITVLR